jgi:hypothetical protein
MARFFFLSSLLPFFVLLLLLKPTSTDALTSAELPVPARTHTFNSYLQDPVFTALVPVFVATALRLQGSYCEDDVKALMTVEGSCWVLTQRACWGSRYIPSSKSISPQGVRIVTRASAQAPPMRVLLLSNKRGRSV